MFLLTIYQTYSKVIHQIVEPRRPLFPAASAPNLQQLLTSSTRTSPHLVYQSIQKLSSFIPKRKCHYA